MAAAAAAVPARATAPVRALQSKFVAAGRPADPEAAWRFYRSIGSPRFVVAPMVDHSELAFRMLTRRYKADLCYTPMIHAKQFTMSETFRREIFDTSVGDRPLVAQFCANNPDILLEAARHLEDRCDAVDINLGCPQGIAKRGNYGAYLLTNVQLIVDLVSKLHTNLRVPVTCKVRVLQTEEATLELVRAIRDAGCSILTVHGRTIKQKKQLTGKCNWDIIRRIKQELDIPVFANGGVASLADVEACLRYTGVDGVMVSEGLLSNPALFSGLRVSPVRMAGEYLSLVERYPPPNIAFILGHLFKILHRELSHFTRVRDALAAHRSGDGDFRRYLAMIREEEDRALRELGPEAVAAAAASEEARELELDRVYAGVPTWYFRHQTHKPQVQARVQPRGVALEPGCLECVFEPQSPVEPGRVAL